MQNWSWGRAFCSVLLGWVPAGLAAQQALVVEHGGKLRMVRMVRNDACYFEEDGKLVATGKNARAALAEVSEFLPFFVSVAEVHSVASNPTIDFGGSGSAAVNHQFEFSAALESPFDLKDMFFVLELELQTGKYLYYHEIGELRSHKQKPVHVVVPVALNLGEGHFKLHLFSEGGELLHSHHPPLYRDQMLDRMTLRRVDGVNNAPLRPFVVPAPEYPKGLVQRRVKGTALVRFKVSRTGAVVNPEIVSASMQEFGDSALAAVRLWRFLPAVKNGVTVEARAELPVNFTPPTDG